MEKGLLMVKRKGFVVVKDTTTDMVCMRLVSLNASKRLGTLGLSM